MSHEKMTPCTSTHAPLSSTEQSVTHSVTPPRPTKNALTGDQRTPDHAEEGVDAETPSIYDVEAAFSGSSHVTRTGTIETTFLVNEELVPINIEKTPDNYILFKLVFII